MFVIVFMQASRDGSYGIRCSPAASTYKLSSCFSPLMYIGNEIGIGDSSRFLQIVKKVNTRELLDVRNGEGMYKKTNFKDTSIEI